MLDILKPARYINAEWNSVHKEWKGSMVKFVLCFPDIYEIGMSHLGIKILYGILNNEKDVLCERAFAPWSDMERKMALEKEALRSLENKRELKEFDIIGFSLQYEMNYVDALNMLQLGGVPVYACERGEQDPLVIAGGPCSFNPEPMADFIDAFVVGEAEEAILEITDVVKGLRFKVKSSREEALKELSKIDGVYVPSLSLEPRALSIKKRIIRDLDSAYFPTAPIVPYIQTVHDRIGIEVMRGCPHRCRFCQAGKIFRPLRIRSVERILEIAVSSVKNTGYEKISLLSLSTGDYPFLEELTCRLEERLKNLGVKISLPSLRVKSFDAGLLCNIVRRGGVTFAPESGSDRLRKYLNKNLTNDEIVRKSNLALMSGWRNVKLYFMIGLPGETYEDLDAIIELASKIKNASLSISSFVPKPQSEFERCGMERLEILEDKAGYLKEKRKEINFKRALKMDLHDPKMSRIEAILCRGDRKMGEVIYKALQKRLRLQAWKEYFNYNLWVECFRECGVDPESYLKKETEESLPWSFIHAGDV